MRVSTLAKPSLMFAMAGLAMPAHATVVFVSYSPTVAGTPITIGASATPQFTFKDGSVGPFAKDYIIANGTGTVAYPSGIALPAVASQLEPYGYLDGVYPITFDIGTKPYEGSFTVDGVGNHISEIDYSAVPEPVTWAMMLLGLGAIGAALRIRRQDEELAASA